MAGKKCDRMSIKIDLVTRYMSGSWGMTELCHAAGVSRKTGYEWAAKAGKDGLGALAEQSRAPRGNPLAVTGDMVLAIINCRKAHPFWGARKLSAVLARDHRKGEVPSCRTINRILRRAGLIESSGRGRPRRWMPKGGMLRAAACNQVWTVDFKGWWRCGDGSRCTPLTVRDAFSRCILAVAGLGRTDVASVQPEFERVFRRYGLPSMIRADNGAPFASLTGPHGLTRLSVWFRTLGIELDRSRPGHPEDNGAHERMHLDLQREVAGSPSRTLEQECARMEQWRLEYNQQRPHEALGMRTPASVYRRSRRKYPETVPGWEYPAHWEVRRVKTDGQFKFDGRTVYVSEALVGQMVGLEPVHEGREPVPSPGRAPRLKPEGKGKSAAKRDDPRTVPQRDERRMRVWFRDLELGTHAPGESSLRRASCCELRPAASARNRLTG